MLFFKHISTCLFFVMVFFTQTLVADEYRTIDWIELMPKDDLEALSNPPEYLNEIEDGSFEDQIININKHWFQPKWLMPLINKKFVYPDSSYPLNLIVSTG